MWLFLSYDEAPDAALPPRLARKANARLDPTDLSEPLKVVLKLDGEKSEGYPADLRSLYDYDGACLPRRGLPPPP